jgi:ATP-dependent exoDNAse (exonuclease V) alpha subunit
VSTNRVDPAKIQEAVARARARMAEQKAAQDKKNGVHLNLNIVTGAVKAAIQATPIKEIVHESAVEVDHLDHYCPGIHWDVTGIVPGWGTGEASKNLAVLPNQPDEVTPIIFLGKSNPEEVKAPPTINPLSAWHWNEEQAEAIRYGTKRMGQGREDFCLIGAAGTGKTTTLKGILREGMKQNLYPPLERSTKWLSAGAPGIVLVSYTRRAVRNIAKQMPADLRPHCLTIHKLLEFGPEFYEADILDAGGQIVDRKVKMRFAPFKHSGDPLPSNLTTIVIDEASMVDLELFAKLLNALPNRARVQFIVLGDLNQLPPVYGQAILGKMLLENPIIELTQVYRQALESPIIALALAVKNNNFKLFNSQCADGTFKITGKGPVDVKNIPANGGKIVIEREGRGKVTLHPWKQKWEQDEALTAIKGQINAWIASGEYQPDEDIILCPWNESFGTLELNRSIANKLGVIRNADVYEIIAGFQKHYLAVGDKLLVDKHDCIILGIERNPKYLGKRPSPHSPNLDRWGSYRKTAVIEDDFSDLSDVDIDDILSALGEIEDRTAEASHVIKVRMLDTDEELFFSKSATFNSSTFGYAITVHKAQGSECRKVFFLTHYCHSAMLMRELVYTAITRASEELYIVMSPQMLAVAAARPRIKGDTLAAKLAWYQEKLKEKLA